MYSPEFESLDLMQQFVVPIGPVRRELSGAFEGELFCQF